MEKKYNKIPQNAKRVFKGVIFDVWQWDQKMYDGSTATFEGLKRPDASTVLAAVGDKILVQKEQQPDVDITFVSAPGGRCDAGEDSQTAAARELLEETGYVSEDWLLFGESSPPGKIDWTIYTYIARNCIKKEEPHVDAGEKIEPYLITLDELLMLPDDPNFRTWELSVPLLRARFQSEKKEELRRLLFGA